MLSLFACCGARRRIASVEPLVGFHMVDEWYALLCVFCVNRCLQSTMLYYTILYYTILLCCTIQYYIILYYTIIFYTILDYAILYYSILHYTILYHTLLYYTILYDTILYYTILYYTILYYQLDKLHSRPTPVPERIRTLSQTLVRRFLFHGVLRYVPPGCSFLRRFQSFGAIPLMTDHVLTRVWADHARALLRNLRFGVSPPLLTWHKAIR